MSRSVMMIHGMCCRGDVWDGFRGAFEARGWRVATPTLRHHDIMPDDPPPEGLGVTSLLDYAQDLEAEIRALPEKPVLIGHSMGGLLAQMLAARGLARAAVLLCPAAPSGIISLQPSTLKTFGRVLTVWGFWRRPMRIGFAEACYGLFNGMPAHQQRIEFDQLVWESGRAGFEIGFWALDHYGAAKVDTAATACPVLTVGAGRDRATPVAVVRRIAARYARMGEYREYPDMAHMVIKEPGWEQVAADVATWLERAPTEPSGVGPRPGNPTRTPQSP